MKGIAQTFLLSYIPREECFVSHAVEYTIESSRHSHMRELRIQYRGDPYRVLYAFDPRRAAILLMGGNKKGNDRWYQEIVPAADDLYDEHLKILRTEGVI